MSDFFKNIFHSLYNNEENEENKKNYTEKIETDFNRIKETWGWFADPEELFKQSIRESKRESTLVIKKNSKTQSNK